ncbi:MAG: NifU family protein [Acidimicrobiales bacterium]
MAPNDVAVRPLVSLTPEAHQVVVEAIAREPDHERLALWLEVRGAQEGAFVYDLYFQALADADADDAVERDGELAVVVPAGSVDQLRGARLEWSTEGDGGLVLVNPNVPEPDGSGVPAEVLEAGMGPIGTKVASVLEEVVNPSIAGHGGRADLVAMDENEGVVYLRLSGGCQGCAMSRMTLTQGIETALRDEVPEVRRVVDVTDHSGGENPYY